MKDEEKEEEQRKKLQMIGIYVTIPFILAVPPVIGWLIGTWLDKFFGTSPLLMYLLIILGFAAGIRELYRVVKNYGNGDV